MKKKFVNPCCEVVNFGSSVIAASVDCICWDGDYQWAADCTGDGKACVCTVNHIAGTANCTPA